MALIDTVTKEKAEGIVKEGYDLFLENIGVIPKPMEMMSASPTLFQIILERLQYLARHPKLSFPLLSHIRYIVAYDLDYPFCTDFNKLVLKRQGVSDDDLRKMEDDPTQSLLEENESAMLAFVLQAIKSPKSNFSKEIEKLKEMGWSDCDILDALSQGVSMIDHAIMMEVFQMGQECIAG